MQLLCFISPALHPDQTFNFGSIPQAANNTEHEHFQAGTSSGKFSCTSSSLPELEEESENSFRSRVFLCNRRPKRDFGGGDTPSRFSASAQSKKKQSRQPSLDIVTSWWVVHTIATLGKGSEPQSCPTHCLKLAF